MTDQAELAAALEELARLVRTIEEHEKRLIADALVHCAQRLRER